MFIIVFKELNILFDHAEYLNCSEKISVNIRVDFRMQEEIDYHVL